MVWQVTITCNEKEKGRKERGDRDEEVGKEKGKAQVTASILERDLEGWSDGSVTKVLSKREDLSSDPLQP